MDGIQASKDMEPDKKGFTARMHQQNIGCLIVVASERKGIYVYYNVGNLHLSECYNCKKVAAWCMESSFSSPAGWSSTKYRSSL